MHICRHRVGRSSLLVVVSSLCKCKSSSVTDNKPGGSRKEAALHDRLTVLRAERGVSRAEPAAAVGVDPQTIGFLERGDYGPSAELALKICEFFELPVEAVFSLRPFTPMSKQFYRPSHTGGPACPPRPYETPPRQPRGCRARRPEERREILESVRQEARDRRQIRPSAARTSSNSPTLGGTTRTRRRPPARKRKRGRKGHASRVRSRAHAGRQIGRPHRRRRR